MAHSLLSRPFMDESSAPPDLKASLCRLADTLVAAATQGTGIYEGVVTSMTRMPYRRLDFDGRALAYIRCRPRKNALRIDVPGAWITPKTSRLAVPGAIAANALAVSCEADAIEAAAVLI